MKLIDGKSVLLGMGLGIIITAILGVLFFAGYKPELSDSEIMEKARRLGMKDPFSSNGDITRNADGSLLFVIQPDEPYTEISKRLYEAGVIESSLEFEIMIKKEKLENSIRPGRYSISYKDDTKSIIQKMTGSNP